MEYPQDYGNYTLLEAIGKGGMSAIDLAQTSISTAGYVRFLVIKRIQAKFIEDDSFIRMFQDEARIVSELQHANIAQVYSFGQQGDEYYMAMEYVAGVDLREVQRAVALQRKRIPLRISLRLIHDVLLALHYAHTRVDMFGASMNIVHRDVNPRNVMISTRGEVKLIDFGVAKASTKLEQTIGHVLKGKYSYMSPEQIEGKPIDGRSDVFALGLVLYELLENRRPFLKQSEVQILRNIVKGNIPDLELPINHPKPELVRQLKEKALALRVEDRYLSAEDMRLAILQISADIGGIASDQELSDFVRENLPVKIKNIENRLNTYRQETTQTLTTNTTEPTQTISDTESSVDFTLSTISKRNADETLATESSNPTNSHQNIETTFPNQQSPTEEKSFDNSFNSSYMLLFVSICILIGSLFWMWKQGEINNTQVSVDEFGIQDEVVELQNKRENSRKNQSNIQSNTEQSQNKQEEIVDKKTSTTTQKEETFPKKTEKKQETKIPKQDNTTVNTQESTKESTKESIKESTKESTKEKNHEGNKSIVEQDQTDNSDDTSDTNVEKQNTIASNSSTLQEQQKDADRVVVFFIFKHDVEVFLDGKSLGIVPKTQMKHLPAGRHVFLFVSIVTGNKQEKTIVLEKSKSNEIQLEAF